MVGAKAAHGFFAGKFTFAVNSIAAGGKVKFIIRAVGGAVKNVIRGNRNQPHAVAVTGTGNVGSAVGIQFIRQGDFGFALVHRCHGGAMDHGIRFPFTVGVSAGACNGLSYMSGQRGRAKASNIDLMDEHHYIGFRYLLTQRCIMDFKLLFEDFPERIIPYDYEAYFANPDRFVMVTTNCLTGKAEYFEEKSSSKRVMDIVRASSSLPFVSPIAHVDGVPMLDGGIADSIPVEFAMNQGYEKLVVILTRNKGYRKKDSKMPAAKVFYHKYPSLQKALSERNAVYNRTMDLIESLEEEGRITVIRPLKPVEVSRMEKDTSKLLALYQEGYDIAKTMITAIISSQLELS